MFAGFYTLASGALTQQRKIDVISNNLLNVQTPGYRADGMEITAFEKELLARQTTGGTLNFGAGAPTAVVGDVYQLMHSGTYKDTGRQMDVAIDGEGFFNIQATADNAVTYLTRNGQLGVDTEGFLELPGFGRVLDQNGATIQVGNEEFTIDENGDILNLQAQPLGRIGVTTTAGEVVKLNNGMFQLAQGEQAAAAVGYRTVQGQLELSNVNQNQQMSELLATQRAFQNASSAIQIVDTMNGKAATQIAAV